jgi:PAS domain S-box-containing protein
LAEGIPQLVWRSRSNGERTWGSPQWIAYSGLNLEQSVGFSWLDAVHVEDREAAIKAWAEAERSGIYSAEYRVRQASDGVYRWFQARAVPVRDPSGHIVEWLGTATDIDDQVHAREVLARGREELERLVALRTADLANAMESLRAEAAERGNAEEALRQSQKMEAIGRLTGGIAHDFNNILQGIAGSVEIARRRAEDGRIADVQRFLDVTKTAVNRAGALTHRLLAFARRQRLDPRPVDPDGLVAGMAEMIRRAMGPGIRVELNLRDGAWGVLCDPNELENALLNLCINARDAMPEGGRLVIRTVDAHLNAEDISEEEAQPGDFVEISVADNGEGMTPEVMARVFEPFYTTKPLGQGTGLGLSQVYGFVRQSHGIVQIESVPNSGTIVRLFLPRHDRAAASIEPVLSPDPEQARVGQTLLLVDDEEDVRRAASEHLRDLGYQVLEAEDGLSALHVQDGLTRLDLLVTDVGLPNGMNGRQVAEAVRQRWPGLPVLFITGYSGTTLVPGSEVVRKPFDLDTLARRVHAIMSPRR